MNRAKARYSSIGGGFNNLATGRFAAIAGGSSNTARGKYSACLGNFCAVRADNSLLVNLIGSRKATEATNTIEMWVDKFYINSHDVSEVYEATSRRERRLAERMQNHVQAASVHTVTRHAQDQAASLSEKVAELRRTVSRLSDNLASDATIVQDERRQLHTCLLYTSPSPRDRG